MPDDHPTDTSGASAFAPQLTAVDRDQRADRRSQLEAPASTTLPADPSPRDLVRHRQALRKVAHEEHVGIATAVAEARNALFHTSRILAAAGLLPAQQVQERREPAVELAERADAAAEFKAALAKSRAAAGASRDLADALFRFRDPKGAQEAAQARKTARTTPPSPTETASAEPDLSHDGGPLQNPESSVAAGATGTGCDLGVCSDASCENCTPQMSGTPDLGKEFDQRNNRVQKRMRFLDEAREISRLVSLRNCNEAALSGEISIGMKESGDGLFAGLFRCGSVWACPECSPVVRSQRAADMEAYALAWLTHEWTDEKGKTHAGHGMGMATLTSRHGKFARLADRPKLDRKGKPIIGKDGKPEKHLGQLTRTANAWRRMLQSRWWRDFSKEFGIIGATRAIEVTHSWGSGWHTHIHAVLWTQHVMTEEAAKAMEAKLFLRWLAECEHGKLGRPDKKYGVKVDPARRGKAGAVQMAKYIVKLIDKEDTKAPARALGNELLRGDLKDGRQAGRNPFEILRLALLATTKDRTALRVAKRRARSSNPQVKAAAEAEMRELLNTIGADAEMQLWHEYERATKGHRMLTWTGKIRDILADIADVQEEDGKTVVQKDETKNTKALFYGADPKSFKHKVSRVPGRRGQLKTAIKVTHDKAKEAGLDPVPVVKAKVGAILESWGFTLGIDLFGQGDVRWCDPLTGQLAEPRYDKATGKEIPLAVRAETVPIPRRDHHRAAPWQTPDQLHANAALIGSTPRDLARPEQARRRANNLPIARELPSTTTPAPAPTTDSTTRTCIVCNIPVPPNFPEPLHLLCDPFTTS